MYCIHTMQVFFPIGQCTTTFIGWRKLSILASELDDSFSMQKLPWSNKGMYLISVGRKT